MTHLLLDADGVVLKRHGYFSERFAKEQGVPLTLVTPFFINEFVRCQEGKADLREAVAPYLPSWKWDKGIDAFLEHWFTTDTIPDDAVLEKVRELRAHGTRCYLASGQERYRAAYIEKLLADRLDGFFFTFEIGCLKSDPAFFAEVLTRLAVPAREVSYVDNSPAFISAAASLSITARLCTGPEDLATFGQVL